MTKKEILEYNKLCAEFLTIYEEKENELQAYPEQQYSPLCSYANSAYSFDKEDNVITTVWDYCKFHSDWNWIMEVVEAIEKLDFETQILDNGMCIEGNLIIERWGNTKKEGVIETINQFLIWYKENK